MTKNFVLQFDSAPDTRWLYSDEEVAEKLQQLARQVGILATDGPQPLATVVKLDDTPAHETAALSC